MPDLYKKLLYCRPQILHYSLCKILQRFNVRFSVYDSAPFARITADTQDITALHFITSFFHTHITFTHSVTYP